MRLDYSALNEYDQRHLTSHLVECGRAKLAGQLLSDLDFLQAILAKVGNDLLTQFSGTLAHLNKDADFDRSEDVAAFRRFIELELDTLRRYPDLIIQQAANAPEASAPCQASRALFEQIPPFPWLSWMNKPQSEQSRGVVLSAQVQTVSGYPDWAVTCRWTCDGSKLLTGFSSKRVIEWDSSHYHLLHSWDQAWNILAWSADCEQMLVAREGRLEVRVWPTGEVLSSIVVPDSIKCHDWHEPSGRVVFGCRDGQLCVWSLANGALTALQDGKSGVAVKCCGWSPDGASIVSGSGADPLRIWDVSTGNRLGQLGDARNVVEGNVSRWVTFAGHRGGANACSWSPDGQWIASGSGHGFGMHADDFSVRVWDARTFSEVAVLSAHRDRVTSCHWSPDSNFLATTSGSVMTPGEDNSVRVWDVRTWTEIACFRGHGKEVVTCAWSSDGRRLASVSKDGTAMIWTLATAPSATDWALNVRLSHSGRLAAVPLANHRIAIFDLATGAKVTEFTGHSDQVTTCAWSFDDSRLASGSSDRTARIWLVQENKEGPVLSGHKGEDSFTAGGNRVVWGEVTDCAWSPSTYQLVTAGSDRLLIIWDGQDGERLRTLLGHIGPVDRCCWTADGERIVSLGGHFEHIQDGMIKLWDPELGSELGLLAPSDRRTDALRDRSRGRLVSPDGDWMIEWGGSDRNARIRVQPRDDPAAGVTYATEDDIICAAWCPDGTHVVVGGTWITVVDRGTGAAIARFRPRTPVHKLCVSGPLTTIIAIDEGGGIYLLRCRNCFAEAAGSHGDRRTSGEFDRITKGPADGPLDRSDPEAWLRFIRGIAINETEVAGGLERCCRQLVEADSGSELFHGAIADPYGANVQAINGALWAICGEVLAKDRITSLKCLRTTLFHDPENFTAWDRMGCHFVAEGDFVAARDCFVRCLECNALESIALAEALFQQMGELELLAKLRLQTVKGARRRRRQG